jgi:hypothetical protein
MGRDVRSCDSLSSYEQDRARLDSAVLGLETEDIMGEIAYVCLSVCLSVQNCPRLSDEIWNSVSAPKIVGGI